MRQRRKEVKSGIHVDYIQVFRLLHGLDFPPVVEGSQRKRVMRKEHKERDKSLESQLRG